MECRCKFFSDHTEQFWTSSRRFLIRGTRPRGGPWRRVDHFYITTAPLRGEFEKLAFLQKHSVSASSRQIFRAVLPALKKGEKQLEGAPGSMVQMEVKMWTITVMNGY